MTSSNREPVTSALVEVFDYTDEFAQDFHDINVQWISSMFVLEPIDRQVLSHPRTMILDPGGVILLARVPGLGVVGTACLMKVADGVYELTKMGVRESARGLKIGEVLLAATLQRAQAMALTRLFLLTNHQCEAAIHLYEKLGFEHSADIMAAYGAEYERCDVAMLHRGR